MANYIPKDNSGIGVLDDLDTSPDTSSYLQVSANKTSSGNKYTSEITKQLEQFMLRQKDKIKTDSLTSSYLHVEGSHRMTISAGSLSYISVEDSSTIIQDSESHFDLDDSILDYKSENKNTSNDCFSCLKGGIHEKATHRCHTCPTDKQNICYKCLQNHYRWFEDHDVTSLSVSDRTKESADVDSNVSESVNNAGPDGQTTPLIQVDHCASVHPKVRKIKEGVTKTTKTNAYENTNQLRFFKDKLLLDITRDQQDQNQVKPTVSKFGSYDVKAESDRKRCFITDMCQLENKQLLLADSENISLKLVDQDSFKLLATKKVEGYPNCLCSLHKNRAAVSLNDRQICVVNVGNNIELEACFETQQDCKAVATSNDTNKIILCFSTQIYLYTVSGNEEGLFTVIFPKKPSRSYDFRKMARNTDEDFIFVTDRFHGILQLDTDGSFIREFSNECILPPSAICLDIKDNIYITNAEVKGVFRIDNFNIDSPSIEQCSISEQPISLCYERTNNRLVVGHWCSDRIDVFALK